MKQIKHGSVCIHFLDFLLRFANEKGLDAKALILMARLDPHVFEDQDSRMPAVTFMKVWNHIADYCEDPHFGLHLGSHLTHFPFSHIVFSVMLNDRNLLSALKNMIRYHNLMSDLISPRLFVDDKTVVFSIEKQDDDIPEKRQYSEFIFAMVLTFLRYLNAGKTDPQIVRFSHGKPDDFSEQTNFFKSKIVFGDKKDEMVLQKSLLESKINLANPDISMVDIAFLLGFSEQSAFIHAFKIWTGQTPNGYRVSVAKQ